MDKYPRTFHLPFSQEIHSDDKVIDSNTLHNFIHKRVIITEKLDGGNTCLKNGLVYARTHSSPATHPSFSPIKKLYSEIYPFLKDKELEIFGENMYAIHSIEYTNLTSFFYVFAIRKGDIWLSFDDVKEICAELGFSVVPILYDGFFRSLQEIKDFMDKEIKLPSLLGGEKEGFVIRMAGSFKNEEFSSSVAKYVRKGHIQTTDEWKTKWKKATIHLED